LYVYAGANGKFDLYEDDGVSYGYERNAFSRIPMQYDDTTGELLIGARTGSYEGMPQTRTLNVRWITPGEANAANLDSPPDATSEYSGQPIRFKRETAQ
jgi:alpha-D-xyloside xylohydrolase